MHQDKAIGIFMGSAIGDALGAPLEFLRPEEIKTLHTEMTGGGVHDCAVGETTDDTAMMVCISDAYITQKHFAPDEIALNFMTWKKSGYFGTRNYVFDIGRTVSTAISTMSTEQPYQGSTSDRSSGNGSIMRLAPVILANHASPNIAVAESVAVSLMTHGNAEIVQYTAAFVAEIMAGKQLDEFDWARRYSLRQGRETKGTIMHAYNMAWHCVNTTYSFEDAVVMAVNKGDDADTVGAVTGMLAGRKYGYKNIPRRWLDKLVKRDELVDMAEKLYKIGGDE
jgi:ADP-ribosyl-[dinitrogen reductase] hydrolase